MTAFFAGAFIPRITSGFSTRLSLLTTTTQYLKLRSTSFLLFTSNSSETSDSAEQVYASTYHAPVMYKECIDALLKRSHNIFEKKEKYKKKSKVNNNTFPNDSNGSEITSNYPKIFIDGTLGGGGHSQCLLESLSPGDILIGCDVDPSALATASMRLKNYIIDKGDNIASTTIEKPIFIPVRSNFRDLEANIRTLKHPVTDALLLEEDGKFIGVDGILLDLGISSHQIDNAERGFAFMKDGPLDMRMSGGDWRDHVSNKGLVNSEFQFVENYSSKTRGFTAADICNNYSEQELIQILREYGDEPRAKQIARSIVDSRPLTTTGDLKEAIAKVTPEFAKKGRRMGRTATLARVFQSLRIVVNDEDKVLIDALEVMAPNVLKKGGRLVVLTYHSMEDRAVKRVMRDGSVEISTNGRSIQKDIFGNEIVVDSEGFSTKPFKPLGKKQKATEKEVEINSRARSATLRVAERL